MGLSFLLMTVHGSIIDEDDDTRPALKWIAKDNTRPIDGISRERLFARSNRMAFRVVCRHEIFRARLFALAPSLLNGCLDHLLKQRPKNMVEHMLESLENSLKNNGCHRYHLLSIVLSGDPER